MMESFIYRILGLALMIGAVYLPERMFVGIGPATADYSAFLGGAGLVLFLFPPSSRFSMADLKGPVNNLISALNKFLSRGE